MELPSRFTARMRRLLGQEYKEYLSDCEKPGETGLRVNTLKWTPDQARDALGLPDDRVPWTDNGFYLRGERMSRNPGYFAGLYYLQEPSAMAPAALLPVEPGDRVLDLCAAPGGKSTELGARLRGEGVLVANDISSSRAKGLLKNLERFGIPNICVVSEPPERLERFWTGYFDKILVDAPCSGEGMFRKDPDMIKAWEEKGPEHYAPIQRDLLKRAAGMLKGGGYLLYSTCTFSETENEEAVRSLLAENREMELVPLEKFPGAEDGIGLPGCIRMYPHRLRGEGHFAALLRKKTDGGPDEAPEDPEPGYVRGIPGQGECPAVCRDFLANTSLPWEESRFLFRGGCVYYLPKDAVLPNGLRYLRTGLLAGSVKNGRFEPSQALAMVLGADSYANSVSFSFDDERVIRYLKGETVFLGDGEADADGWVLVCADGFGLGFARGCGRTLKNKYYPGWRWL